jgi:hypothetical protein
MGTWSALPGDIRLRVFLVRMGAAVSAPQFTYLAAHQENDGAY